MGQDIPTPMRLRIASKILALLVALSLFRQANLFEHFFSDSPIAIVPDIILCLVFISGLLACIGLFKEAKWGFFPLYFYIPATTMFLKLSFIPYLPDLVPITYRGHTILAINSLVLIYSVFLLLRRMDRNLIYEV
ncbi:hypothetical protein [Photobacterium lucens]|uniref:hypothetical protein n=1 Tax=Photobacterium lucens TaxID=2562949 RepID=UPI0006B61D81|nr:hypothetical protein [Photobacterium lucens]KPA52714.1 membrane protein [Photobacterium leiognathi subsp. mandapamensis]MBP2699053.1 hypothetical protein [Vibrio parahaemolyticus]MZG58545.1 hypothetical protein [Photobacterium lucens]MZG82713.1 hypothetical protein [Photobacterium lucens]PSV23227.1 hypothetical protein C0W44_00100 [Photobacterium leiognathi subsp. mandapamensis]